ncbi:MAG: glycosyltransferase family 61 protein [Nitratireductor sp.]
MGLTCVDGVVLAASGEPFNQGELLAQYFSEDHHFLKRDRERFARRAARAEAEAVDLPGRHVLVSDRFSGNYYHWLCDSLPRLEALCQSEPEFSLLLPPVLAALPFVRQTLPAWPGVTIAEFPASAGAVRVEELAIPDHAARNGDHAAGLIAAVRERLVRHFGGDNGSKTQRRIHVSRAGARIRSLANEAELLPVFERHGFETVIFETLDFPAQLQLMLQASVLVGIHGAGLANMMFMVPGSSVLELRQIDRVPDCFFSLAAACNHDYRYLQGTPQDNAVHPHAADISIDPGLLDRTLQQMA